MPASLASKGSESIIRVRVSSQYAMRLTIFLLAGSFIALGQVCAGHEQYHFAGVSKIQPSIKGRSIHIYPLAEGIILKKSLQGPRWSERIRTLRACCRNFKQKPTKTNPKSFANPWFSSLECRSILGILDWKEDFVETHNPRAKTTYRVDAQKTTSL